jgi:hypothetical protein
MRARWTRSDETKQPNRKKKRKGKEELGEDTHLMYGQRTEGRVM